MSATNNHGGKREGAGRPKGPGASTIAASNKIVERKLRSSAEQGWEVLADHYPDIMRKAVELAIGGEKQIPNITLLRTLLELMVKVSGTASTDNETVTDALVKGFIEDVRASRNADAAPVEQDNAEGDGDPDSRYIQWASPDSAISRMGQGLPFSRS